ncbi:TBP-associated factor 8 family protein [Aspergillus aculeatinus CBS 121060]|uniref:Bromodomain associated domain protein n=1 Tax=Aspergillus aculeatinus CBS 121060 TaxID=1448322 RepID=A0ACD1GZX0_9EURO|nr:bromodomain associated domain protein [Aspergillus aculeatinus CBS 121060]RAH66865.1 bromodomain associated domain protein [Aspergillus aculeatinus CBS 121060]
MVESEPTIKRSASSSSPEDGLNPPGAKRIKRHYHHHHRLQSPVNPALPEPAIVDDACVDQLLNRSISQYLRTCGFEVADPAALDAFRRVTEEYILSVASYVRQSMLSSRRTQPIPHDFDDALRRHSVPYTDLLPHVQPHPNLDPIPTPQPTPPPEEDSFKTLPSFGPQLSGEDDRVRSSYIPKHFPAFPSKHTYRHTAVFTEREQDARKIRERATEDGRHGEEALRKLARAAFKDNQFGSSAREKKPWGRRAETMDSMFEKTVKGLAKRMQRTATVPGAAAPMEIDSGAGLDTEVKPVRSRLALSIELPPIINCEREFWRRVPSSGARRAAEDKQSGVKKEAHDRASRVDSWVST